MATTQPSHPSPAGSGRRRLLLALVASGLLLLIALAAILLLRSLAPHPEAVLRLTPAAAAVDEQTTLLLSGSGWGREEDVAICASATADSPCDADSAFEVVQADRTGAIEVDVLAGPLLSQGMTTFIANGIESGQVATRSFRVLKTADLRTDPTPAMQQDGAGLEPRPSDALTVTAPGSQDATPPEVAWQTAEAFADWRGEYFSNPTLSGQAALTRNDAAVEFDWGEGSPADGLVAADGFSVRWTRTLPFAAGPYRFMITANDGARLLVDNRVLIEAWDGPSDQPLSADLTLSAGNHQITVEFVDNAGPARVAVGWSPILGGTPDAVAGGATFTPTPGQGGVPQDTPTATWTAEPTDGTPTPTVPPGSTATPTPTAPPGSTATPTPTVPPGSTATPTPTAEPTVPPGSTVTATPTSTTTPAALLMVSLNPAEAKVGVSVRVSIAGDWPRGASVFVILAPRGVTAYQPPVGQSVAVASATTSNDGSPISVDFVVPDDARLLGVQPIQLVVHTGNWSHWKMEPFTIVEEEPVRVFGNK